METVMIEAAVSNDRAQQMIWRCAVFGGILLLAGGDSTPIPSDVNARLRSFAGLSILLSLPVNLGDLP